MAPILFVMALAASCDSVRSLRDDHIDSSSKLHGLSLSNRAAVDASIHEPSDLVWDASRGIFWTVSDRSGSAYPIDRDGAVSGRPLDLKGSDLEGITLDPATGHLFVLDESNGKVVEVARDGRIVSSFTVPGNRGNAGLEGITHDPVTKGFVLVNERGPAEMVFVTRAGKVTARKGVRTEDLSAITAAPDGQTFFVVGRFEEAVLEVDREGRIVNRLAINAPGVEGLAFDDRGRLVAIADRGSRAPGELLVFAKESER